MHLLLKLLVAGFICLSLNAHAGLYGLTHHSRANCLNNESITWWAENYGCWRVVSIHKEFYGGAKHKIDTDWRFSSRVAAVHWGEGSKDMPYTVWGYHYDCEYSEVKPVAQTHATDCQIIDGWI